MPEEFEIKVLPTFPEDSATLQPLGDEDATIQITVLPLYEQREVRSRPRGLLTVRAKDQDLSADQFEALGLACLAAAKRIRGA